MENKDLKGFEYIGDVPAYNKRIAQNEYLPLYVKKVGEKFFFATDIDRNLEPVVCVEGSKIETPFMQFQKEFTYNAVCNDYLFLNLPAFTL